MKNLLIVISFIIILPTILSAQWKYGGGMKFNNNTEFKALAINAKVGKDIAERFDFNVDIAYYIASKASWSFDFDLHYRLFNINDKLLVDPVAGINFTKTNVVNNSLGIGVFFRIPNEKFTYYVEPKWILDNKQFVLGIGVLL